MGVCPEGATARYSLKRRALGGIPTRGSDTPRRSWNSGPPPFGKARPQPGSWKEPPKEPSGASQGAKWRLHGKRRWTNVSGAAEAVVLTLKRIDWSVTNAHIVVDDTGRHWDLRRIALRAIAREAGGAAGRWADRQALLQQDVDTGWATDLNWRPLGKLMRRGKLTGHQQGSLKALISNSHWPQARIFAHERRSNDPLCQLCREEDGTLIRRRYR